MVQKAWIYTRGTKLIEGLNQRSLTPVELNVDNMPLLKEESFSAIFAGFIWEEHVEMHTKK